MATSSYAVALGNPRFRAWNQAGTAPLAGGKANFYQAGTTTPLATYPTYVDALAGTNANANPVVLDANGEATIFITSAAYKVLLQDSAAVSQWTIDNVYTSLDVPRSLTTLIKSGNMASFGSATKVTTWTSEYDALTEWSAANNRWVATYAGKVIVLASAEMSDTGTNVALTLAIHKNGSQVARSTNRSSATASQIWGYHAHYAFNAVAADYIEIFVTGSANTTVQGTVGTRLTVQGVP
jgi:hypothetical protein